MKKLLKWHDAYTLKILVAVLIAFVPLYPKLPSININNTWVYIRLEDFLIFSTVFIWFIQLLRRKVSIFKPIAASISIYWIAGLISLVWSVIYFAPLLPQLFPHVAALSYIRRVEYMILFFVAFSTIRNKNDLRDYVVILSLTIAAAFIYGMGQRYYIILWSLFPSINQSQFCFPSFQTGNEEFAKGIPLCLPPGGRITSTFGGSYDLGAYTALVTPIILGIFLSIKKKLWKILTGLTFFSSLTLLVLTAQRASFIAYIAGGIFTLVLYKKKKWIVPLLAVSIAFLFIFNEGTAKRFLSTFRVSEVVVDQEGRLVGDASVIDGEIGRPVSGGDLPEGSAFIGLPENDLRATDSALVKRTLSPEEARRLRLESGSIQISTVSGSFLVKKVLVYDISFTTRFQAEWPNAWRAFERNPLLGSGYSSITLATDNDYFRALGETGLLGFFSFFGIFIMIWAVFRKLIPLSKSQIVTGFSYGLLGGILALLLNATLIDVFEASKVAETLWILVGIATGSLVIYQKKKISYFGELLKVLSSNVAFLFYVLLAIIFVFVPSVANFFAADDFTWLKWAATDNPSRLLTHFADSQGFFYRPFTKIITYVLYTLFSFQPQGYHYFIIFLHFLVSVGAYFFAKAVTKSKFLAFLSSIIFVIHPTHAENVFWYSGLSGVLASVFMIYAAISFYRFRQQNSRFYYALAFILSILAFASYEMAVAMPVIFLVIDSILFKVKKPWDYLWHIPFLIMIPLYYFLRILTNTFQSGGDYAYNFAKIVPNIVGNFFGYIGIFLAGDYFLPYYNSLRISFRSQPELFFVLLVFLMITIFWVLYRYRSVLVRKLSGNHARGVMFGLVFAFAATVPFLPLGNIAPRYLYLSSIGFAISLVLIISYTANKIFAQKEKTAGISMLFAVLILSSFYIVQTVKSSGRWSDAGFVTKNTLYFFRSGYPDLTQSDIVYIVNNPVTYNGIWTFPTGVDDGLWFVYRDNLPEIRYADSIDEARSEIDESEHERSRIFRFDKYGDIREIR